MQQSPKLPADLRLGYMAALKLLGKLIIRAEIISATFLQVFCIVSFVELLFSRHIACSVDKFKMPDLKFTLPQVRFR